MKKKWLALCFGAMLLTLACGAACKEEGGIETPPEEETPPSETTDFTLDEGSAIDGAREEFYGDRSVSFTEPKSGITVTTWVYLGENGLYLYTQTDDKSVYYSEEKQFYENDSVEYYIDPRPEYSLSPEALSESVHTRPDCVQIRVNAIGNNQTWIGRNTGTDGYPWAAGYLKTLSAAKVNGELNTANGADGYSVEVFVPWSELGCESKPTSLGVMPAFNNVNDREDTSRTWYTAKGMGHASPTSYALVDENGFADIGENLLPLDELTADAARYEGRELLLNEVTADNLNAETRATMKAYLGQDGVYFLAVVNDKVLSRGSDNIWNNDGIEILIDSLTLGGDNVFRKGIFRVGVDIDNGIETDIIVEGYSDYVPQRKAVFAITAVSAYEGESAFGYEYTYTYEVMVPYTAMGLESVPDALTFAWAVKSPNETAYVENRTDAYGTMEGQDWLWTDKHYPCNPEEYYEVTADGITPEYAFPEWGDFAGSDAPERYDYRGFAADDGLYLNVVQYLDGIVRTGDKWYEQTHIEMEIWQGDFGWGWGGTYFAFFLNDTYYINNDSNVFALEYRASICDRGTSYEGYRYEISYEIYIGFLNNAGAPQDGPYAYVQFMSYTPNDNADGYENAIKITKDGDRILWTDDCNSYGFRANGVSEVDRPQIVDPDCTVYSYQTEKGAVRQKNGVLYSDALRTLAVARDATFAEGTFSSTIVLNAKARAGVVFGYEENENVASYYLFYANGADYTVGLVKVTGDSETLLYSNFLSASFQSTAAYPFKVEITGGRYYCYFWNTMYTIGDFSGGTGIGFASDVAGSKFCNVSLNSAVADRTVDTLIIGHSYMELWSDYRQDLSGVNGIGNCLNVAISGSDTQTWNLLVPCIAAYQPSYLIYNIGINDLFFGKSVDETYSNVASLLADLHTLLPECKVLLLGVSRCVTSGSVNEKISQLNEKYRAIAETNDFVAYVELEYAFCDANQNAVASWFTDGLHPTQAGYRQIMVPAIAEAMNSVIDPIADWTDWSECGVRSDAQSRYDYRGFAADDGLYLNMVQYVDNVVRTGDAWNQQTHVEMEIWQGDFGYGWGGTYFAFFLDGSYYCNNNTNITEIEYRVTITDRGADYSDGFRYAISYEIYIGFANNLGAPQDGPYAYVKLMSYTPGESNVGYENATTITKDGVRTLWTDNCNSCEFRRAGVVGKDVG